MKTILVYSAKGGVGKSSCSAAISRFIANKCEDKSVFVIDMDINTPSMDVIFKNEHPKNNIWVVLLMQMFGGKVGAYDDVLDTYNKLIKNRVNGNK